LSCNDREKKILVGKVKRSDDVKELIEMIKKKKMLEEAEALNP
jgi:hypothetical protein